MPSHHRRRSSNSIVLTPLTTPSKALPSIALDTIPPPPPVPPTLLTCPHCALTASYILNPTTQTSLACTSCLREFKKNANKHRREEGLTSFPRLLEEYEELGEIGRQDDVGDTGSWSWIMNVVWRGKRNGDGDGDGDGDEGEGGSGSGSGSGTSRSWKSDTIASFKSDEGKDLATWFSV